MAFMFNTVGPDYFRTLRIPLTAGREFEDRDDETAAPVVVVNATLAERFWGGAANAIGKRIRARRRRLAHGRRRRRRREVRTGERGTAAVFLPAVLPVVRREHAAAHPRIGADRRRCSTRPGPASRRSTPTCRSLAARPFTENITGALLFYDLAAAMLFVFGAAGMALAVLGTYGLVAHTVKQSTHEIGIRMALGASRLAVLRGFLGRGLRLGAIGAALGAVAALGIGRLLERALFGVSATDAVSFSRALAIVLAGVIVATLVPAWRAARTDPLRALRHQ